MTTEATTWRVIRSSHTLPQVFAGDECVTDRVFNGHESLIAASPDGYALAEEIIRACDPRTGRQISDVTRREIAPILRHAQEYMAKVKGTP